MGVGSLVYTKHGLFSGSMLILPEGITNNKNWNKYELQPMAKVAKKNGRRMTMFILTCLSVVTSHRQQSLVALLKGVANKL
jgi:hypothetical protein